MGILNFKNMYRFNFFITVSTITFLMSCNIKTKRNACIEGNWQQTPNYIIKEDLSSKDYSEVEGYFPKEGLVPTAEIAFQIAEPILKQIYGSKKIENEKPFSINIEDDVWVIEGHLDKELLGGVAYMEIRKSNGEILKVIHTK